MKDFFQILVWEWSTEPSKKQINFEHFGSSSYLLPRAITLSIFAQNQSPGRVWKAKTKPNLPGSIEKASLILNAQKSKLNKKAQFIDFLLKLWLFGWKFIKKKSQKIWPCTNTVEWPIYINTFQFGQSFFKRTDVFLSFNSQPSFKRLNPFLKKRFLKKDCFVIDKFTLTDKKDIRDLFKCGSLKGPLNHGKSPYLFLSNSNYG